MGWETNPHHCHADRPVMDDKWLKQALCRGIGPSLFFAENGDIHTQRQAVTFCQGTLTEIIDPDTGLSATTGKPGCPVRSQCLEYALSFPQDQDNSGVYGGVLPSQRVILRSAQRHFIHHDPRDIKRKSSSPRNF